MYMQGKQKDAKERDYIGSSKIRLVRYEDHCRNRSSDFHNYKKDFRHDRGIKSIDIHLRRDEFTSSKGKASKRSDELSDCNSDRMVKRLARERDYHHSKDSPNCVTEVSSGRYHNNLRSGRL